MRLALLALPLLLTACLSPMHHAAERGDVDEIRRLAAAGADPNVINEEADKWTPLLSAVRANQPAAVKALLEVGADPSYRTGHGTARELALQEGRLDIAMILKQAEAARAGSVTYEQGSSGIVSAAAARAARATASALLRGDAPAAAPAAADPGGRLGLAIGATREGALVVNAVIPGSPAEEGGFQAGDRLVAIDDRDASNMTVGQAAALLRGVPGTSVGVTVQRGEGAPIFQQLLRRSAPAQAQAQAYPSRAPEPAAPAFNSDVDRAAERSSERPDDFALVIGVEEYQSLPKADYGVRDARTVRRHFAALGIPERNIVTLEGSGATKSKLASYLQEWLPLNVKPESTLFVYYSGHGAPDARTGDAYLVPWDGDPKFLKSTAYPLKQFYADLAKVKAKRVVVALDACFSGAGGRSVLAKGARPLVVKVDDGVSAAAGNMTVLAAASGDEITGTLDDQGHGLFTYYFLKGLSGAAKGSGGAVTPRSLYDYLKPRVQDEARRQNREQTPTFAGSRADEPLARY
jgi:hypothetical protein